MLTITTPAFAHEAEIPMRYTQEGENLSPELVFSGVPANARSLVLLSDDPDAPDPEAPKRIWLHWLVVNIPTETAGFAEGVSDYPQGCRIAVNDSGVRGWSGPRPPIGRHRYYFKLYALDTTLDLPENFTRSQVEAAMAGHVIESAVTMGTYLLSSNRYPIPFFFCAFLRQNCMLSGSATRLRVPCLSHACSIGYSSLGVKPDVTEAYFCCRGLCGNRSHLRPSFGR